MCKAQFFVACFAPQIQFKPTYVGKRASYKEMFVLKFPIACCIRNEFQVKPLVLKLPHSKVLKM